jgi:dephospho-CoA kinase
VTRVVALTGNIAAGKSAVTALLRARGIPVIDADAIVHELQRPGTDVFRAIHARFGDAVLTVEGTLDRAVLRRTVLADDTARRDLEAIVHPAVFARRAALLELATTAGTPLVVVDIPLLFEVDDPRHYDAVLLVDAPVAVRRDRLVQFRGLHPDEADRLIALQLPADRKRALADAIIENDADLATLAARTDRALAALGA